jgi:hypothetical protein
VELTLEFDQTGPRAAIVWRRRADREEDLGGRERIGVGEVRELRSKATVRIVAYFYLGS